MSAEILALIQKIEDRIAPVLGPTTLSDPTANQADPLVNLVTANLAGLVALKERFQAFQSGLYPWDAEGEDLTLVAQLMGTDRQIDQPSKVPVIVSGQNGHLLPVGTILLDAKGNEWVTISDAVINGKHGWTNACSPIGAFDLDNGELRLQNITQGITSATNSTKPDLGGVYESDEALRRRLTNRRPLWRVKETADSVLNVLTQISGVLDARVIAELPECLKGECNSVVIGVLGGEDSAIAQTIYDNVYYSLDRLIGDKSHEINCTEVHWQPLCPILIEVKYWLKCDCTSFDINAIEQQVVDRLNALSLTKQNIGMTDLCSISDDLIKAEFRPIYPRLAPECYENDIENPITGGTINYTVSRVGSLCHYTLCDNSEDFADCLNLPEWYYPIFSTDHISQESGCPCQDMRGGCGCR